MSCPEHHKCPPVLDVMPYICACRFSEPHKPPVEVKGGTVSGVSVALLGLDVGLWK